MRLCRHTSQIGAGLSCPRSGSFVFLLQHVLQNRRPHTLQFLCFDDDCLFRGQKWFLSEEEDEEEDQTLLAKRSSFFLHREFMQLVPFWNLTSPEPSESAESEEDESEDELDEDDKVVEGEEAEEESPREDMGEEDPAEEALSST